MRAAACFFLFTVAATAADWNATARDIFRQLIETNTTDSSGDNTAAAKEMADRFHAAGYAAEDVQLLVSAPRKGNLVVRLRGTGQKRPILFLSHLDVVEAKRSDWTMDPFKFIEKDGYFYGRGTSDIKNGDTYLVTNFLRLKQEGFRPDRDYILAITSDEEGGDHNGVEWLVHNRRDLIDAEFCINTDSGDAQLSNGKKTVLGIETAEKLYFTFELATKNPGGHSSRPTRENAIYQLAAALDRLQKYEFPIQLNDTTRAYLDRDAQFHDANTAADMRALAKGTADSAAIQRLSASPYLNAQIRTTCVPTMITGGHAENALPQSVVATVNCRIVPGESAESVQAALTRVVADSHVSIVAKTKPRTSPASPLNPVLFRNIETTAEAMWPGITVMPVMDTGASDGRILREAGMPTYGIDPTFMNPDDDRAHGQDERIPVASFYGGVDFYYNLMKALGK